MLCVQILLHICGISSLRRYILFTHVTSGVVVILTCEIQPNFRTLLPSCHVCCSLNKLQKFAHAQHHREPLAESLNNNDSKESVHWEPVRTGSRYPSLVRISITIYTVRLQVASDCIVPGLICSGLQSC